jgi:hypothetical protein
VGAAGFALFLALWFAGLITASPDSRYVTAGLDGQSLRVVGPGVNLTLSAARLREGLVRFTAMGWSLRLRDDDGVVYDVGVADEATAERWLDALGLDAPRRAVRVASDRTLVQWAFAYFFGGFFAMPLMLVAMLVMLLLGVDQNRGESLALMYLAMLPGYWLAARAVGHVDVSVGADGVRAGRGLRRRFFPVGEIEGVAVEGNTLALRRANARAERYRFERLEDAHAVARRVAQVIALHRAAPRDLLGALAAADATTPEAWRDVFLDAVKTGGYRALAFTAEDLAALVVARDVTAPQRLGAALALRALDVADGPAKVRVAAEALVDPAAQQALAEPLPAMSKRAAQG